MCIFIILIFWGSFSCTLSPKSDLQKSLEIIISPSEDSLKLFFEEIYMTMDHPEPEINSLLLSPSYILNFFKKKKLEHSNRFDPSDQQLKEEWQGKTLHHLISDSDKSQSGGFNTVYFFSTDDEDSPLKDRYVVKVPKITLAVPRQMTQKINFSDHDLSEEIKTQLSSRIQQLMDINSNESIEDLFHHLINVWQSRQLYKTYHYFSHLFSQDILNYIYSDHLEFHIFLFFKTLSIMTSHKKKQTQINRPLKIKLIVHYVTFLNFLGFNEQIFNLEENLRNLIEKEPLNDLERSRYRGMLGRDLLLGTILSSEVSLYLWKEATLKQEYLLSQNPTTSPFITHYRGSFVLENTLYSQQKSRVTFSDQYDSSLESVVQSIYHEIEPHPQKWGTQEHLKILDIFEKSLDTLEKMQLSKLVNLDSHIQNYAIDGSTILMDDYDRVLVNAHARKQALNLVGIAKFLLSFTVETKKKNFSTPLSYTICQYFNRHPYQGFIQNKQKEVGFYDLDLEANISFSSNPMTLYYQFPILIDQLSYDILNQKTLPLDTQIGKFFDSDKKIWTMLLVQVARSMIEGDYDVKKLKEWVKFTKEVIKNPDLYQNVAKEEQNLLCVINRNLFTVEKTTHPPIISDLSDHSKESENAPPTSTTPHTTSESTTPSENISPPSRNFQVSFGTVQIQIPPPLQIFNLYIQKKQEHEHNQNFKDWNLFWHYQFSDCTVEDLYKKFGKSKKGGLNQLYFLEVEDHPYVAKRVLIKEKQNDTFSEMMQTHIRDQLNISLNSHTGWMFFDLLIRSLSRNNTPKEEQPLFEYLQKYLSKDILEYLNANHLECYLLVFLEALSLMMERDKDWSSCRVYLKFEILSYYFAILNALGLNQTFQDEENFLELIKNTNQINLFQKNQCIKIIQEVGLSDTKLREDIADYNWKEVTLKQKELRTNKDIQSPFAVEYKGQITLHSKEQGVSERFIFMSPFEQTLRSRSKALFKEKECQKTTTQDKNKFEVQWSDEDFFKILDTTDQLLTCLSSMQKAHVVNIDSNSSNYGIKKKTLMTYDYDMVLNRTKDLKQGLNLVGLATFIFSFVGDQNAIDWGYFELPPIMKYLKKNPEQVQKLEQEIDRRGVIGAKRSKSTMEFVYQQFILLVNQWTQDMIKKTEREDFLWNMKNYPHPVKKVWTMFIVQITLSMIEGDYDVNKLKEWSRFTRKILQEPHLYQRISHQESEWLRILDHQNQIKKSQYPPFNLLEYSQLSELKALHFSDDLGDILREEEGLEWIESLSSQDKIYKVIDLFHLGSIHINQLIHNLKLWKKEKPPFFPELFEYGVQDGKLYILLKKVTPLSEKIFQKLNLKEEKYIPQIEKLHIFLKDYHLILLNDKKYNWALDDESNLVLMDMETSFYQTNLPQPSPNEETSPPLLYQEKNIDENPLSILEGIDAVRVLCKKNKSYLYEKLLTVSDKNQKKYLEYLSLQHDGLYKIKQMKKIYLLVQKIEASLKPQDAFLQHTNTFQVTLPNLSTFQVSYSLNKDSSEIIATLLYFFLYYPKENEEGRLFIQKLNQMISELDGLDEHEKMNLYLDPHVWSSQPLSKKSSDPLQGSSFYKRLKGRFYSFRTILLSA